MMLKKVVVLCPIVMFALTVIPLHVNANPGIIRVPGDYAKIQDAINNASPGDSVQVSSGTYHENLFINKTLILVAESKDNTTLDGNGGSTVIQANSTSVSINGFTIVNASYGIILENCTGSTVTQNDVRGCRLSGIWLHYSNSNTVSDNYVSNTAYDCGIVLCGHSSNNVITRNVIENNAIGIALTGMDNLICGNTFLSNQNQTQMIESFNNTWNSTCEGNYWSNYNGTDFDAYGVGATPYVIDANNQDNLPLKNPYTRGDINHDAKVNIIDINIMVVAFKTQPGAAKWNPHADIDENNEINIVDISIAAKNFGKGWLYP